MCTKTDFREEPYLLETVSAGGISDQSSCASLNLTSGGISESELIHGSDVHIKNECVSFASNVILQSHCNTDCYYDEIDTKIEIKEEPTPSEQKCESEVTCGSDIHTNYKSGSVASYLASSPDSEIHSDVNEINTKIEIKDEPAYSEITFIKVKSEQEEIHPKISDYSCDREDDPFEENQELSLATRLDTAAVGIYEFGVTSTDLVNDCLNLGEKSSFHHDKSHTTTAPGGDATETQACKFCGKGLNRASGFPTDITDGGKRKDLGNICDSCAQAVQSYRINLCDKYFTQSHKNTQILVHENRKPYRCSYCEKTFTLAFSLKIHKLAHEGKSPYKCDQCGRNFASASYLKHHKLLHEGKRLYQCDHCDKNFITSATLKQHILIHEGIKPYKCNQCDKYFTQKSSLKRHILVHKGIKPYKCSYCEKNFTSAFCLKIHELAHEGKSPYKCDHCDQNFASASYLKHHKLVHEGKRLYRCDHCDKSFITNSALNRHILIHEHIKPYKCNQCDKYFTEKSKLMKHISVHEGKTPYHCNYCEKSFTTAVCLKMHKLIHEGNSPYKCDHCEKKFLTLLYLEKHKLLHEANMQ